MKKIITFLFLNFLTFSIFSKSNYENIKEGYNNLISLIKSKNYSEVEKIARKYISIFNYYDKDLLYNLVDEKKDLTEEEKAILKTLSAQMRTKLIKNYFYGFLGFYALFLYFTIIFAKRTENKNIKVS